MYTYIASPQNKANMNHLFNTIIIFLNAKLFWTFATRANVLSNEATPQRWVLVECVISDDTCIINVSGIVSEYGQSLPFGNCCIRTSNGHANVLAHSLKHNRIQQVDGCADEQAPKAGNIFDFVVVIISFSPRLHMKGHNECQNDQRRRLFPLNQLEIVNRLGLPLIFISLSIRTADNANADKICRSYGSLGFIAKKKHMDEPNCNTTLLVIIIKAIVEFHLRSITQLSQLFNRMNVLFAMNHLLWLWPKQQLLLLRIGVRGCFTSLACVLDFSAFSERRFQARSCFVLWTFRMKIARSKYEIV